MNFEELIEGDKVDIQLWGKRVNTYVHSKKGVRIKQVQVRYRYMWFRAEDWGKYINVPGGELCDC